MRRLALFPLAALLLTAAPGHTARAAEAPGHVVAYADSAYAPFAGEGDASIAGTLRARKGCEHGCEVLLDPVTPHSASALEAFWSAAGRERRVGVLEQSSEPRTDPEPRKAATTSWMHERPRLDLRALRFRRTARSDGKGAFTFSRLPPGEYYLWAEVPGERSPTGVLRSSSRNLEDSYEDARHRPAPQTGPGTFTRRWVHRRIHVAAGDHLSGVVVGD